MIESLCRPPAAEGLDRTNVRLAASQPALPERGPPVGELIAEEACSWIGTPFVWQGRVKQVGVDCKGLVAGVASACGRPEGESLEAHAGDYGLRVDPVRLRRGLVQLFDPVHDVTAGDVLLLRAGGQPVHLALAIDAGRMVHCYARGPACVIEARIEADMLDSIWRWREVPQ